MKQQIKAPQKELNKTETSNLPVTVFKTLLFRMLYDLRETFNKETGTIKMVIGNTEKNESRMRNTTSKIKTVEEINSRLDESDD